MEENKEIDYNKWNNTDVMDELESNQSNENSNIITNLSGINTEVLNKIESDMSTRSSEYFKLITFIKYKYNKYQFWNTTASLVIIIMSSTITFLEALRANLDLKNSENELLNFCFIIATLGLGFLIAVITSIIKFFNLQSSLENFKLVSISLEKSYTEINSLLHYLRLNVVTCQLDENALSELISDIKNKYIIILKESVKYENEVYNILDPENIHNYLNKFYKHENNNKSIIHVHTRHINTLNTIEDKLNKLEKDILGLHFEENDTNIRLTMKDLIHYCKNFAQYREFVNNLFDQEDNNIYSCFKRRCIYKDDNQNND